MYYIHNYSLIAAVRVSILRADFIQRREEGRKAVGTPWDEEGGRKVVGTPWDEGYIHIIDNCNGREEPSASWIWDAVLLLLFFFFSILSTLIFGQNGSVWNAI